MRVFKNIKWLVCFLFLYNGAFSQSAAQLDSLYRLLKTNIHDTTRLNVYNELCWPVYAYSNVDSSIKYGNRAIELGKKIQDTLKLITAYRRLGIAFINSANQPMALYYEQKSYDLAKEINHKKSMSSALNNLSVIYLNVSDYKKAIDYSIQSQRLQEEIKDSTNLFNTYYNLGLLFRNIDDDKGAQAYYKKAYNIARLQNERDQMGFAYGSMGGIYRREHKYDSAYYSYIQAENYFRSENHMQGMAEIYSNLGNLFSEWTTASGQQPNLAKALEYYRKALQINKDYQNDITAANILGNMGFAYMKLKRPDSTIYYSSKALDIATRAGDIGEIVFSARSLYEAYNQKGDLKNALKYLNMHVAMKDSVSNIEKQKEISQKQLKYDFEKRITADSLRTASEKEKVILKLEQEKTQRYYLYIGLFLLVAFSFFIYNRFKITQKQKNIIEQKEIETQRQKVLIEVKQKEIVDSINYAKRIQYTLLAHADLLERNLPRHFIVYKPKDIVSGDFYWATQKNELFYLAVCDSTGHGVPGAFMSLLNINFLNEAINEKNIIQPHLVFDYVRERLINSISKENQKDGFDGILLCINKHSGEITYAAANNSPLHVVSQNYNELPKDKMPVGQGERADSFNLYTVIAKPGDMLYLYTDGYADQFGGTKGKKFKYRPLNDLLLSINQLSLQEQQQKLTHTFDTWKGELEQVDDVCIVGIKL